MAIPTRNIKYLKVKVKDRSNNEVQNLISNQNRIVKYEPREGLIFAVLNDSYKTNMQEKLGQTSHFLIIFETLRGIESDIQRQMKDLDNLKIETKDFISQAESTIEEDISFYQREIPIGEQELNYYHNQTMTTRETEEFTNNILLDLFDNDKWILDMHNVKEYERKRGKMIREAEKKVYCSRENLEFLFRLRTILTENQINRMVSEMEAIFSVIGEKSNYLKSIYMKGNLLDVPTPDAVLPLELINKIIADYQKFTSIYNQIKSLNEDLRFNIFGVQLNNKKWLISIPLKGEEAAGPILNKLLDYMVKKVISAQDELQDLMNRDISAHYTKCMNHIKRNIEGVTSDYNSIRLKGSVTSTSTSVSSNVRISRSSSSQVGVDLSAVVYSDYTLQGKVRLEEWQSRLDEIKKELAIYDQYKMFFDEAEQEIINNKNRKQAELTQLANETSLALNGYANLEKFCQNKSLLIITESIPAFIGMFMKHINLQLNSICKSSVSNIRATDIDAAQLFNVMFNRLKKNKKIDYGCCVYFCCCCGAGDGKYSKFHKLFTCNDFSAYDFHEIMLNTRICGSYKNNAGQKQEIFFGLRTEDIQESLFQAAKNSIEIIVLTQMYRLRVHYKIVSERLKYYEAEILHNLKIHKYKKLLKYTKKRKQYLE